MGKPGAKRRTSSSGRQHDSPGAVATTGQPAKYAPDDLIDRAEKMVGTGQFELAMRFCDRALEEGGEHPRALECKVVGKDSAELIAAGVEILELELAQLTYLAPKMPSAVSAAAAEAQARATVNNRRWAHDEEIGLEAQVMLLRHAIASALCHIAEIYLTDLCDEPNAQDMCVEAVERALHHDKDHIHALQTMASICISLQEPDNALGWLERSIAQWFREPQPEQPESDADVAMNAVGDLGGAAGGGAVERAQSIATDSDAAMDAEGAPEMSAAAGGQHSSEEDSVPEEPPELPEYEIRMTTAKLLIELGQHNRAVAVLEQLLLDDAEVVEVWYLLAIASQQLFRRSNDEAALMVAAEYALETRFLFEKLSCEQHRILEHVGQMLAEVPAPIMAQASAAHDARRAAERQEQMAALGAA